jgi:hypothetical protein
MHLKPTHTLLFFQVAGLATEDEIAKARAFQYSHDAKVLFRNGAVEGNGSPEKADFYAGNVPADYIKLYPERVLDEEGNAKATAVDATATGDTAQHEEGAGLSSVAAQVGTASGGWGTVIKT